MSVPGGYTMQITRIAHGPGSSAMLAIGELGNGRIGARAAVLADRKLPS